MPTTLSTPISSEDQTIVDRAIIQNAFKQGFQVAFNAANAVENTIKQIEAQKNDNSADLLVEARTVLDNLKAALNGAKSEAGF